MLISLKKMKEYLKVDFDDDDAVIRNLEGAAEKMVMDIVRVDSLESYKTDHYTKTDVMYATSYLYEYREDADHHTLTLPLRSLLFGNRREVF